MGKWIGEASKSHMISTFVTESGISIGQIAVGKKANEIVEIPNLLDDLDVKGGIREERYTLSV